MKTEFQTKENLIKNLTLDGMTELLERACDLGGDLESYVESLCFVSSTNSFWIESNLVKDKKIVDKYNGVNDGTNERNETNGKL